NRHSSIGGRGTRCRPRTAVVASPPKTRSCVATMDVRCEKCQTEYELDEARLKPGGVTVKCTNCGHMFKIRKRAITNVGAVPAGQQRPRAPSGPALPPAGLPRADSILANGDEGPTTIERQWLIRLENG